MLANDLEALGSIPATSKFISIEPTILKFVWCQRVVLRKKSHHFFQKDPLFFLQLQKNETWLKVRQDKSIL